MCVVHKSNAWATHTGTVGALEHLDGSMLGHVLPPLSGIDVIALMGGLRAADCLLCGCAPVYSVTSIAFKCLWGYATVLGVIISTVFVNLLGLSSVSLSLQKSAIEDSFMQMTWSVQQSCACRITVSTLLKPDLSRTSVFPTLSCLWMPMWASGTTYGTFQADRCAFCKESMFHIHRVSWWGQQICRLSAWFTAGCCGGSIPECRDVPWLGWPCWFCWNFLFQKVIGRILLPKYLKEFANFSWVLPMCMLRDGVAEPGAGFFCLAHGETKELGYFYKFWNDKLEVTLHVSHKWTVICKEHFKDSVFKGFGLGIQLLQVKQGCIQPVLQLDTMVKVLEGMSGKTAKEEVEKCRGEDTTSFHSIGDVNGSTGDTHWHWQGLRQSYHHWKIDHLYEFPWVATDPPSCPCQKPWSGQWRLHKGSPSVPSISPGPVWQWRPYQKCCNQV